jgi:hypothetical protein
MRSSRLLDVARVCAMVSALGACSDSPLTTDGYRSFVLSSVDGQPLPAIEQEGTYPDGRRVLARIRSSSVEFISRDSAWHHISTDIIDEVQPDSFSISASDCIAILVSYRWERDRLVLHRAPQIRLPIYGTAGNVPGFADTLRIDGRGLTKQRRAGTRMLTLRYEPGTPDKPLCGIAYPSLRQVQRSR